MPSCVSCGSDEEVLAGIEIQGFYDGVAYWQCPCGNIIDRHGESHRAPDTVPHPVHPDLLVGTYVATDFYKNLTKGYVTSVGKVGEQ